MILQKKESQNKNQIISELIGQYIPKQHRNYYLEMNAGTGDSFKTIDFFRPFKHYLLNTELHNLSTLRKKARYCNSTLITGSIFSPYPNIDLALFSLAVFSLKHIEIVKQLKTFLKEAQPRYFMFLDQAILYYRFKGDVKTAYGVPDEIYSSYLEKWVAILKELKYKFVDYRPFHNKMAVVYLFKK